MDFRNFWPLKADAATPEEQPAEAAPPADEEKEEPELKDPKDELKEYCHKKRYMYELFHTLQDCNERVSSREKTSETCEQELFDYVYAIDHCVAKRLFQRLA
ncbi:hypothetical protein DOY81_009888 [Sarcophaga bullata]|nr:hypothetical protein DOY81_009888 [Sarcophaga bullata]